MSQEDSQQQVLNSIQELKIDVDPKFAKLDFDIREANIRIDAYQKSLM